MLLGKLYTINDLQYVENNSIRAKIDLNQQHVIFEGHFPGRPVVPGVCLTQMITDTISLSRKKNHHLLSADFIKFIQLVIPTQVNQLSLLIKVLDEKEGVIRAEASIFSESITFLKFKGSFYEKEF